LKVFTGVPGVPFMVTFVGFEFVSAAGAERTPKNIAIATIPKIESFFVIFSSK
jgi:hypothetical protein